MTASGARRRVRRGAARGDVGGWWDVGGRRGTDWEGGQRDRSDEIWGSKRGHWGRRLGQAPPDSIGGVQQARTPRMRSYPRRTTYLYASDTDRWSRPLNRVCAPPVSIRGVQKTCTPRLSLHPGRTWVLYAADADSRVPPLYVISLFHYIMGLTSFLFFSFLSFFPFISCFHRGLLHFMRIARYFMWVIIISCGSQIGRN
jgi:hypothetical protein